MAAAPMMAKESSTVPRYCEVSGHHCFACTLILFRLRSRQTASERFAWFVNFDREDEDVEPQTHRWLGRKLSLFDSVAFAALILTNLNRLPPISTHISYALLMALMEFLDQELISYRHSSCCRSSCFLLVLVGRPLQNSPRLRRFKSDRDKICQIYSSSKIRID